MIDTVLRVSGGNFDVKKAVRNTELKVFSSWEKGERSKATKRLRKTSGLNSKVCSSEEFSKELFVKHQKNVVVFIKKHKTALEHLRKLGANSMEIDIGVMVGEEFMLSASFEQELLKVLLKENITLNLTIYPNSEDE